MPITTEDRSAERELRRAYSKRYRLLREAQKRLERLLNDIVKEIDDKVLVRAEVRRTRTKTLRSLVDKARRKGRKLDHALSDCEDLVGGRVVCNNVEDVYRFAELLKDGVPVDPWSTFKVKDYIKEPKDSGYRQLHVYFCLPMHGQRSLHPEMVPCEVQIRSRLQDAWSELSRSDMYKQADDLPPDLVDRMRDLANVLATADETASAVRARVHKVRTPPDKRPELSDVTDDALAYVFRDVFGRSPEDHVVRRAMNLAGDYELRSLQGLSAVLRRDDFRRRVDDTTRSIIGMSLKVNDFFLAGVTAVAIGEARAVARVRRDARREWREIEEFARREELAGFPATADDLLELLEDPTADGGAEGLAEVLGATHDCYICGTTVVEPFAFAEAAVQHYRLEGDEADQVQQRIESAVRNSATEIGGYEEGPLCAYHAETALKD